MPHSVKEGDTPTLKWDLDRDLTGVSEARVLIAAPGGSAPIVSRVGSTANPTPADGVVSVALQVGDYGAGKLEAGETYLVEVQTQPGPLTHPDDGYERLHVLPDLGP